MGTGLAAALLVLASSEPIVNVVHREMNLEPGAGAAFAAACAPRYARMGGDQASSDGVSKTLEFSLVGLDGETLVSAVLRDAAGHVLRRAHLTTSLLDTPTVCERLIRTLLSQPPPEGPEDLVAIPPAAYSRRARARLDTEVLLGLRMGGLAQLAPGSSSALLSMGFDGRLEGDRYFVEIAAGIYLPMSFGSSYGTPIVGIHVSAGAAYILTATNVAPYVGMGIEGRVNIGSNGLAGLVPYAQVGLLFARRAPVGLYLEFRVGQHVVPSRMSSSIVFPTEVGGALGIGW